MVIKSIDRYKEIWIDRLKNIYENTLINKWIDVIRLIYIYIYIYIYVCVCVCVCLYDHT